MYCVIDAAIGDPTADPVVAPTISAEALTKIYDISTALNLHKLILLIQNLYRWCY